MDHQERPVLSRLDRLDRLLQLLEERDSSSPVITKLKKEDECKSLSSALEEVNHKGTLMERLTMLESRVLQLSLEMEVGNTSKASSSTVEICEKIEPKSSFGMVTRDDEEIFDTLQVQEKHESTLELESRGYQKGRRRRKRVGLGWFRMGC